MIKAAQLDHLVIGATTLEEGVAYVKQTLGVDIPSGGSHTKMGTHNHLMQLGADTFLEVIAIDTETPAPKRPRWYGLDDPWVKNQLQTGPSLLTWVVNTDDLESSLQGSALSFGSTEAISRGELKWLFGLPKDGRLLAGGMLPYLMQWQTDEHPARRMTDCGCRLLSLDIYHPNAQWLNAALDSISATPLVQIYPLASDRAPYLAARIESPAGVQSIYSIGYQAH